MTSEQQFLRVLGFALSGQGSFLADVESLDWDQLLIEARKHALVGVLFSCFSSLPQSLAPDRITLMRWGGLAANVRLCNQKADQAVSSTVTHFAQLGYSGLVLKGQGLAQYYPDPTLRTSGDVDYWAYRSASNPGLFSVRRFVRLARQHNARLRELTYHHIDYGQIDGVDVELHWRPSWFYCPRYNRRFLRFCFSQIPEAEPAGSMPVPTDLFNEVFLLVHIYRHLFYEGIGLKQVVDYYYFRLHSSCSSVADVSEVQTQLRRLGMLRFAAGMMHILQHQFGLPAQRLICQPDAESGQLLLDAILEAGNMGRYDAKNTSRTKASRLPGALHRLTRNLAYFRFGPFEVLFSPFWRLWHLFVDPILLHLFTI